MKTFFKIAVIAALLGSQAFGWWLHDATVKTVVTTETGVVGVALEKDGSTWFVNFPTAAKKEMMATALSAQASGKNVSADVGGGMVKTIVIK